MVPIVKSQTDPCVICKRKAVFSIGRDNEVGKFELIRVCGYHDRLLGTRNLMPGFSLTWHQAQAMDIEMCRERGE